MKFDAILNLEELGPIMTSPDGLTTELKVLNCGNEVHRITVENYQIILWDHRDQGKSCAHWQVNRRLLASESRKSCWTTGVNVDCSKPDNLPFLHQCPETSGSPVGSTPLLRVCSGIAYSARPPSG
jgi:hypothetical protein